MALFTPHLGLPDIHGQPRFLHKRDAMATYAQVWEIYQVSSRTVQVHSSICLSVEVWLQPIAATKSSANCCSA